MNSLPADIENIIMNYKREIEIAEHKKIFINTLNIINNIEINITDPYTEIEDNEELRWTYNSRYFHNKIVRYTLLHFNNMYSHLTIATYKLNGEEIKEREEVIYKNNKITFS